MTNSHDDAGLAARFLQTNVAGLFGAVPAGGMGDFAQPAALFNQQLQAREPCPELCPWLRHHDAIALHCPAADA
jgi:hypothetical protein